MGDRSRSSGVDGRRAGRAVVVFVCGAIVVAVAAAWVMRARAPQPARLPALTVTAPPAIPGGPRRPAPTADDEGERIALSGHVSGNVPAAGRLRPSPRTRTLPPAAAHPRPPVPRQTRRAQASPSAGRPVPSPANPAPPPGAAPAAQPSPAMPLHDPPPSQSPAAPRSTLSTAAQGQTAPSQAPATGGNGQSGGSGSGGAGAGDAPGAATGEAGRTGGGAGQPAPPPADPVQLVPPRVISYVGTDYPGDAFRVTVGREDLGSALVYQGTEGSVRVRALVRADGRLGTVEVTAPSGSVILDRAAIDAVRRWVFAPATRNGVPTDAFVTFTVHYVVR